MTRSRRALGWRIALVVTAVAALIVGPSVVASADDPGAELPGIVDISGTAVHNHVLTASTNGNTWSPAPLSGAELYQWYRNGQPIQGETTPTHLIVSADVGASLTASVTASARGYAPVVAVSAPIVPVESSSVLPVPTITGTPQIGEPLVAHAPQTAYMQQHGYDYAWYVNGQLTGTAEDGEFIPDRKAQIGAIITVAVWSFAEDGEIFSDPSAPTAPVADGEMHPLTVTLLGPKPLQVNEFIDPWLSDRGESSQVSYVIYRDGVAISTNSPYTTVAADWHHYISVVVTETFADYPPEVTSTPSMLVGTGYFDHAPTYVAPLQVGADAELTDAAMQPVPQTMSVEWMHGCDTQARNPVIGRGNSFIIPAKYAGACVYAMFTVTAPHIYSIVASWTTPQRVRFGTLPTQATPTVSGSPLTGSSLEVTHAPLATSAVAYSYQWYSATSPTAKPVAIAHATSSSYVPPASLKGRIISVRVTASKLGYTSESTYSAGTVPLLSPTALQVHPLPPHAGSVPTGPAFL